MSHWWREERCRNQASRIILVKNECRQKGKKIGILTTSKFVTTELKLCSIYFERI